MAREVTIQTRARRWTRPLFNWKKVERSSSARMAEKPFMAERESRQERGMKMWKGEGAVGTAQGSQRWGCLSAAHWDACHLSRLELVIQQSSFSLYFFFFCFVIQTDRVFLWLPYRIHFRSDARGYSIRDLNNAMCKFIMLSVPEHVV